MVSSGGKLSRIQRRVLEALTGIEPPFVLSGGADILVDSARAILAEKLCALLERSELRDLIDIEALVRSGEDLERAIVDAPRRDSGFSPLTLAWILRGLDVRAMAPSADVDEAAAARLEDFRQWLIDQLVDPRRAPAE